MQYQAYGVLQGSELPYNIQGEYGGLPFWRGGLTLLAASPGTGKTSWLLRMVAEAAAAQVPAALICYEHTPAELSFRLDRQAEAVVGGAHGEASYDAVAQVRARWANARLIYASDDEDTPRAIEQFLIGELNFPQDGFALVAVDYLQRVPVVRLGGRVSHEVSGGYAAVDLRQMAVKHGWGVVAATAVEVREAGEESGSMAEILGDDRIAYEADRIVRLVRVEEMPCGCARVEARVVKDRIAKLRTFPMTFWGHRYYPAIGDTHGEGPVR